jgi:hypothetical protein
MKVLYLVGEKGCVHSVRKAIERLERVAPQIAIDVIQGAGHTFWGYEDTLIAHVLRFPDAP